MRVLHVMATGALSGGANHLLTLLPSLNSLGCECHAAVGSDGPLADRLRDLGIPTRPLELMQARVDTGAPRRVTALVRAVEPDVVHFHGTRAAFFGAAAPRPFAARPRTVYTAHGLSYRKERLWPRRGVFLAAEWLACRRADHVISVSRVDLDDLRRRGFVRADTSSHIPNVIDSARFAPGSGAASRQELGLSPAELVVGTVSRLVPGKAVADLLGAAARCQVPVAVLVMGDGPERAALEQQAQAHHVRAFFLGERNDIPELLRACDLFALPSHWEGEPMALLEAMAIGLPCIATCTPGARDLLSRTQAGSIVPVGDPGAIARAIERWAQMTREERQRLGATGRALVAERRPEAQAQQVLSVYRAVLAR